MPNNTELPEWERALSAAARGEPIRAAHPVCVQLEAVAGLRQARVPRPVQPQGCLDGIDTGIRQMVREEPLETDAQGEITAAEVLRIKGVLILRRNATRDYLDFVALVDRSGDQYAAYALQDLDRIYPHPHDESALQQLLAQLANPRPFDQDPADTDWVRRAARLATEIFDCVADARWVHPADWPQLWLLCWTGDQRDKPMTEEAAFARYERDWRHVHQDQLTDRERAFIQRLARQFRDGRLHTPSAGGLLEPGPFEV